VVEVAEVAEVATGVAGAAEVEHLVEQPAATSNNVVAAVNWLKVNCYMTFTC